MLYLLPILAALCDRRRGLGAILGREGSWLRRLDEWIIKPLARLGLAWSVAVCAGLSPLQALAMASVLWAGQLLSWDPIFAWWERRSCVCPDHEHLYPPPIRCRIPLAVAWRGMLMGLPALPFAVIWPQPAVTVFVCAILGQLLAAAPLRLAPPGRGWCQWGSMEFMRGFWWATLSLVFSYA